MANLCFNSVYLLGNPSALTEISNAIKELMAESNKNRTTLEKLQERLGFECKNWGRSYDSGLDYLDDEEVENGQLYFTVCTAWNGVPDYWSALCKAYSIEYAALIETDGEIYVENDCEKRYFPYEYRLDFYGDENTYGIDESDEYESKEELLTFLEKKSGQIHTLEEWCEIFDEEEIGSIIEIERNGE